MARYSIPTYGEWIEKNVTKNNNNKLIIAIEDIEDMISNKPLIFKIIFEHTWGDGLIKECNKDKIFFNRGIKIPDEIIKQFNVKEGDKIKFRFVISSIPYFPKK